MSDSASRIRNSLGGMADDRDVRHGHFVGDSGEDGRGPGVPGLAEDGARVEPSRLARAMTVENSVSSTHSRLSMVSPWLRVLPT